MWRIILLGILVFIVAKKISKPEEYVSMTDEEAISRMVSNTPDNLKPIEVISRNGDSMRVMFLDTDTYAGKLMDVNVSGKTMVHGKLGDEIVPSKKYV